MNHPKLGVSGILIEHGHVLLGLRCRGDDQKPLMWCTPGGGVEFGEKLSVAVAREFIEETGLTVEPVEGLVSVQEEAGDTGHAVLIFLPVRCWKGELKAGEGFEQVKWFTKQELENIPVTPMTRRALDHLWP